MSVEVFDVLDSQGKPVGLQKNKNQILADGDWRLVTHAWLLNRKNEVLCQQRSRKGLWDNLWDVTVGGGVASGEDPRNACVRELGEELGLFVEPDDPKYVGRFSTTKPLPERSIIAREFSETYVLRREVNPAQLVLQQAEVVAVAWVPIEMVGRAEDKLWVPHPPEYYESVAQKCVSLL